MPNVARLHASGGGGGRAGRVRVPPPGGRRPPRRPQPYRGPPGPMSDDRYADSLVLGRFGRPSRAGHPGARLARSAGDRAGGRSQLPLRGAPGVGHGGRRGSASASGRLSSGYGPTPSATTASSPTWPRRSWLEGSASTTAQPGLRPGRQGA